MKRKLTSLFTFSVAIILCLRTAEGQQNLKVSGSDTLILLGQRVGEMYQRNHSDVHFSIRGGGVAGALKAIAGADSDVAQWEGNPIPQHTEDVVSFPIGVQAIAVYVQKSNAVKELTVSQLRKIFLGDITNWKEVGGPDQSILLYAGESSTSTLAYFQESVLGGEDPYPFVGKSNTKDLLAEIAQHPAAIGYGSLAANPGTHTIALKLGPRSVAVEPTIDNIRLRRYPLSRLVNWAVAKHPSDATKVLCRWVLSPEGQLVVESVGFEPLPPKDRSTGMAKFGDLHNPTGFVGGVSVGAPTRF